MHDFKSVKLCTCNMLLKSGPFHTVYLTNLFSFFFFLSKNDNFLKISSNKNLQMLPHICLFSLFRRLIIEFEIEYTPRDISFICGKMCFKILTLFFFSKDIKIYYFYLIYLQRFIFFTLSSFRIAPSIHLMYYIYVIYRLIYTYTKFR